jgi:tetratricopeptide (TPR) repeat protein
MIGHTQKKKQIAIGLITLMLVLLGTNAFALQEEKISTLSDYLYKKDLEKFKEIQAVTDNQKKAKLIEDFLKERPISRVLFYASTEYMKIAGGNPDRVISMAEKLRGLIPTDRAINAEAKDIPVGLEEFKKEHLLPARSLVLKQLAAAYYQKKNLPKAAELAEQANATAPEKALTQMLFGIYKELGNEAKVISYGKKMISQFTLQKQEGYTAALQLADIYIKKQDTNSAIDMFTQLMNVYGNRVPPNMQEANWNKTRIFAYTFMAKDAYSKDDYAKAEKMFQTVLSYDPRLDEPYYFLGMCKWKGKDQPAAIVYFARCAVLNKDYAAKANGYLEQLYKATYPNDPEGLKDVIAKAKTDLGIS